MEKLRQQKYQTEEDIRTLRQQMTGGGSSSNPRGNTQIESRIASLEKTRDMINDRLRAPVPERAEPPADFFYVHANILFKLKKYKEAFDHYHEAVRINPQHGNAYVSLANMDYMAKKYQKALFYLEKAQSCGAQVNPDFRKALYKAMRKK
jgi:tetratricopeptide (TPR) repeat protein